MSALCPTPAVTREAGALAEQMGVRIFTADIIYHLFDQFTAYLKQVCACWGEGALTDRAGGGLGRVEFASHEFALSPPYAAGRGSDFGVGVRLARCMPARRPIQPLSSVHRLHLPRARR